MGILLQMTHDGVRPDRLISLISETLFLLEDELQRNSPTPADDTLIWTLAAEAALLLEQITNAFPALQLQGNIAFVRAAIARRQPAENIAFFLARSFDAVRAPVADLSEADVSRLSAPVEAFVSAIAPLLSGRWLSKCWPTADNFRIPAASALSRLPGSAPSTAKRLTSFFSLASVRMRAVWRQNRWRAPDRAGPHFATDGTPAILSVIRPEQLGGRIL
ncbi:MAG: hypothetical protein K1X75_16990 [Leptospirales bacterium]|nr:hypothetical protein [Leptospirales bacterium]